MTLRFDRSMFAAQDEVQAHVRLDLARELRRAARMFKFLKQPENVRACRRMAANLDAQRRRIMNAASQ